MLILKPYIFNPYPEIIFGFSPRFAAGITLDIGFNLSYSVGDDVNSVNSNRKLFFNELGLMNENVSYQHQVHNDRIVFVNKSGLCGESDALITAQKGLGLAISIADCTPVFIYDPVNKIIAAVHSGWRGTEKKILMKTIKQLLQDHKSNPQNLIVYIGPSISQVNYEVGKEVGEKFGEKYLTGNGDKFLLDVNGVNYDLLLEAGLKKNNIQKSGLCTYEYSELFHSYRRDGNRSGRSLGIIAMKPE